MVQSSPGAGHPVGLPFRAAATSERQGGPGRADGDVTVQDVVWALEAEGWVWVKSSGSHRQYRHATRPGRVTVSTHASAERAGLRSVGSIEEQSGLDLEPR